MGLLQELYNIISNEGVHFQPISRVWYYNMWLNVPSDQLMPANLDLIFNLGV